MYAENMSNQTDSQMTAEPIEKRYSCYSLRWDNDEEEYFTDDAIQWDGKTLEFDTYAEFLTFMSERTEEELISLYMWRLCDEHTNEYIDIMDGIHDEVSFLSIIAAKENEGNE